MRGSDSGAIAIIFAGGVGSRMARFSRPKQFMEVEGKPILAHTLEHFQRHEEVTSIYLACLEPYIGEAWDIVVKFDIAKVRAITPGGPTAQASILNALEAALKDGEPADTVALIHDGVRPVINAELISRNIAAVRSHGSAITAIPCFETIASSMDGARTVDSVTQRDLMYILQAPQSFTLGEVCRMNRLAVADGLLGKFVDQAHMMHHYGKPLHMVEGFRGNVKITTDIDFLQFRLLLESGEFEGVIGRE